MRVIGIGTDITEIARIEQMIDKHPKSFLERVFTEAEIAYCQRSKNQAERFAARWGAKEAVLKSLGTGWAVGISWRDVEVVTQPSGAPTIRLAGGALAVAEKLGVQEVLITLSHSRDYAVAFAIAQGDCSDLT